MVSGPQESRPDNLFHGWSMKQILAARLKFQRPHPGSKDALGKYILGISSGAPDYSILSDPLAAKTRQQLPELKKLLSGLGALESISFLRVQPGGQDVYRAKFSNCDADWLIVLGEDGRIVSIRL
jgi:hypothetical protein